MVYKASKNEDNEHPFLISLFAYTMLFILFPIFMGIVIAEAIREKDKADFESFAELLNVFTWEFS